MKIQIKVKPNARESRLQQLDDGTWLAQLKASPVDGKANAELFGLLAREFNVNKSQIAIKRGGSARFKLIEIEGL